MKYYIPLFVTIDSWKKGIPLEERVINAKFNILTHPVCIYLSPATAKQYNRVAEELSFNTVQPDWKETWLLHRIVSELLILITP